jgi:hypothetical protein
MVEPVDEMSDEKVLRPHGTAGSPPLTECAPSGRGATGLKTWRAPQFTVSQVADTQFSSNPPTSDGTPVSQIS